MHHARLLPGLALTAALAAAAMMLGGLGWFLSHGLSALTVAILLGIAIGNSVYPRLAARSDSGVAFSKQTLLRAGVVLYGLRLTLHDVGHVGVAGVLIDALVILTTFGLAHALARIIGLDRTSATLIGAGSAICGAAAVMATEPVVGARPEQVTIAVSTVVVFGTLSMFLYPFLYDLNLHWALLPAGADAFGIYAGSTIHEVAQVVAAGRSVSAATANTAVITKLVRVMMLAPFLIALSGLLRATPAGRAAAAAGNERRLPLPWFAFGFIAIVLFNSLELLPARVLSAANQVDTLLLAMAMAALGLCTHVGAVRAAGLKPLLLGGLLFVWLIVGGGSINRIVGGWLA
jgi:uncharacterized integral membrane protein (TIGR00698 family)